MLLLWSVWGCGVDNVSRGGRVVAPEPCVTFTSDRWASSLVDYTRITEGMAGKDGGRGQQIGTTEW